MADGRAQSTTVLLHVQYRRVSQVFIFAALIICRKQIFIYTCHRRLQRDTKDGIVANEWEVKCFCLLLLFQPAIGPVSV